MAVVKVKKSIKSFSKPSGTEYSSDRPIYVEKRPPCSDTCPNGEQVREFLQYIAQAQDYGRTYEESLMGAFYIIALTNPFPATTGRICPHPCETKCNRKDKDSAVNINGCEMYIGDFALNNNLPLKKSDEIYSGKVAIIGAGPSGLSAAYQLAKRGIKVTIFEKNAKPGGMLVYGIPNLRLPKDIVNKEIQRILDLGVEIKCNVNIGKDITIEDLKENFDCIYVAIGAYKVDKPILDGIETIKGVYSGLDFLYQYANGEKIDIGKNVVVIGADTAADSAMISKRWGADVTFAYRRTVPDKEAFEKTASREAQDAYEENITFQFATVPVELKSENGKLVGVEFQKIKVGAKDERGHAAQTENIGTPFTVKADTLIYSVGQKPDYTNLETLLNIKEGFLKINNLYQVEGQNKIFAGGDVVGPKLMYVTTAIGHGFAAAMNMLEFLTNQKIVQLDTRKVIESDKMHLDLYELKPRHERQFRDPNQRVNDFDPFIYGFTKEEFIEEAKRCMSCGLCFDCGNCFTYCSHSGVKKLPKGQHYEFHLETCDGCMKCFENCPCGYIEKM